MQKVKSQRFFFRDAGELDLPNNLEIISRMYDVHARKAEATNYPRRNSASEHFSTCFPFYLKYVFFPKLIVDNGLMLNFGELVCCFYILLRTPKFLIISSIKLNFIYFSELFILNHLSHQTLFYYQLENPALPRVGTLT